MARRKAIKQVTVVMSDGDAVLYTALVTQISKTECEIEQTIHPETNLLACKELFESLANTAENAYFSNRVKTLSREAREAIMNSLDENDTLDIHPF